MNVDTEGMQRPQVDNWEMAYCRTAYVLVAFSMVGNIGDVVYDSRVFALELVQKSFL